MELQNSEINELLQEINASQAMRAKRAQLWLRVGVRNRIELRFRSNVHPMGLLLEDFGFTEEEALLTYLLSWDRCLVLAS
jgi:hypothetical protein